MTYTILEQTVNTLFSGEVQRFHACPTIPCQSVGQHTFGVMVIALGIIDNPQFNPNLHQLMREIMMHDAPEYFTGDMPFTTKRNHPPLAAELGRVEQFYAEQLLPVPVGYADETGANQHINTMLKLSDMLEGLRWVYYHDRDPDKVVAQRWDNAIDDMFDKMASSGNPPLSVPELERAWAIFMLYSVCPHDLSLAMEYPTLYPNGSKA